MFLVHNIFVCFQLSALAAAALPLPSNGLHSDKDPAIAFYQEGEAFPGTINYHQDPRTEIPLWPTNQVPGERPNVIGKESTTCADAACTDRRFWNVTHPTLTPFLVESSDAAMVVAPGGGYGLLAFDREGTDIARWLNSIGISAFVLKYRVPARPWLPFGAAPLMDAQRAMGIVRSMAYADHNSTRLLPYLNASKIGFMGFSAGAHLTGHINVAWANRTYDPPVDHSDQQPCRPDFSIMVYPWRSVSQPPVNEPISGASALNVTHETPPTMLVQTEDDPVAHVENSIYYFLALKEKGVFPSELHIYPNGGHGYGDCSKKRYQGPEVCTWPDRARDFFQTLGVLKDEEEDSGVGMQSA